VAATRCYTKWQFDLDFCTFHKSGHVSGFVEVDLYSGGTKDSKGEAL